MFQYFHELCHMGNRRLLCLLAALGVNYLLFQSILVPYGNGRVPWSSDSSGFNTMMENVNIPIIEDEGMHNDSKSSLVFDDVSKIEVDRNDFHYVGKNNSLELDNVGSKKSFMEILSKESKVDFSVKRFSETKRGISAISQLVQTTNVDSREYDRVGSGTSQITISSTNLTHQENSPKINLFASDKIKAVNVTRRKPKCNMPPKSRMLIQEMNHLLQRRRASSRATRPRWSSKLDMEILAARSEIEHAPMVTHDKELYAPLFRNHSMFKRSYELMERTLKVYIYKEGKKPIFHQPILKGLYASEGWFMMLMEENKQFVVKDPAKAHLFYMPFSSRMLEFSVYVRNSHNRTNLRRYLNDYTDIISAKYRYFNRTGGADHFLVACHDWAPYETRHHMEYCIKALCNSDVTQGFKIGRDVSLPETMVRSVRNPQRDIGGKPPQQRSVLAFYAGNMHGYLRPILLKHWKDKDPDMKILGPMPHGVVHKMSYIQHMKSSKYCICPKGYEVNSPRVVEAIFYECVPVIISDNFVPPFFEVLNWDAFSLILAEKDIPNLKQILLSVPEEKYLKLQLGVRRVQKHFLWHTKPLKYDLFHMTLHSIWYNRVFQINVKK
ncbi:probable glycosyltransferase At3g07620 [Vicia villosa]|uniref:probable glycosyltransferase At3g07620 n=1 Tax=Vicia villosa TaxID=3911 RepID=UPI00273BC60A|nr:probable glycosyltransferase At3g07620 [Vicia villosa]